MNDDENEQLFKSSTVRRSIAGEGCFTRLPNEYTGDDKREVHIWRSVLDRVILDLTGSNISDKVEAIKWTDLNNPDFYEVCELAFLEQDFVYKSIWSAVDKITYGIDK